MTTPKNIWRIFLKPHSVHRNEFGFCYQRDIIGIGWPTEQHPGNDKNAYVQLVEKAHPGDTHGAKAASSISQDMDVGHLVWARNHETWGRLYLGEISGEWEYLDDEEHATADIVSVRKCKLYEVRPANVGKDGEEFLSQFTKRNFNQGYTIREIAEIDVQHTLDIWENIKKDHQI